MIAFDNTPPQFKADLIATCDGDEIEAREVYEIVARDGYAQAYLEAHAQKILKLPDCKQGQVSSLTNVGQSFAESVVSRAVT